MKKLISNLITLLFIVSGLGIAQADRSTSSVRNFTTLSSGVRFPKGIAINPENKDIYVATFDFGPNDNKLLRYSRKGVLLA